MYSAHYPQLYAKEARPLSAAASTAASTGFGLSRPASAVTFSRATSAATGRPRSRQTATGGSAARVRSATVQPASAIPRVQSAGSLGGRWATGGGGNAWGAVAVPGSTERAGVLHSDDPGGAYMAGPHGNSTIMRERWPGSRVYEPVAPHGRVRPRTAMERPAPDMAEKQLMPDWAGFAPKALTRTHSAPHVRVGGRAPINRKPVPPRAPSASEVARAQRELQTNGNHWFAASAGEHWYEPPSLKPLKNAPPSLSGMKLGIATVKANLHDIHDRCDSARDKMDVFREEHEFPQMVENLYETLGPEIALAREEMTGMFEQMRIETHDLQQQVDVLKHEKNSIAYVLFRMDQKVGEIEDTMGVRATIP